jgi:hypothetical protein
MTEKELIDLGFHRIYLDENSDKIDQELIDINNIYFFYELELINKMVFQSNGSEELINDNWIVDFGFDDSSYLNGFKIESYEIIKSIIDLFKTIKLR